MLYELRVYTTFTGQLPNLLKKLETKTFPLWEKHGIKQVGFWTTLIGPDNNVLHYMLAWESMAEREQKWTAFQNDPAWAQAKAEAVAEYGQTNRIVSNVILQPTKFSNMQ